MAGNMTASNTHCIAQRKIPEAWRLNVRAEEQTQVQFESTNFPHSFKKKKCKSTDTQAKTTFASILIDYLYKPKMLKMAS